MPEDGSEGWLSRFIPHWTHEEAKEKDRIAKTPVADQPDYAGEGIGEKVFPPEVEAGFAQGAG
jgi:hypothetical protein